MASKEVNLYYADFMASNFAFQLCFLMFPDFRAAAVGFIIAIAGASFRQAQFPEYARRHAN